MILTGDDGSSEQFHSSVVRGIDVKFRVALATGFAASALVIIPSGTASAHVHGITPLRCTPAPENAGANQTEEPPASADAGLTGAIPITKGGNVELFGGGFNAAACTQP